MPPRGVHLEGDGAGTVQRVEFVAFRAANRVFHGGLFNHLDIGGGGFSGCWSSDA